MIHDIGRFAPGEGGCIPLSAAYENRDHGIYLERAASVTIKNNIFYNNKRGWSIHVYSGTNGVISSNLVVAHNTFGFPNPYRPGQIILAAPGVVNAEIKNNMFYCPNNAGVMVDLFGSPTFSNIVIANNLIHGGVISSPSAVTGITITDNMAKEALMVDPNAYNFRLQAGSEARNSGAPLAQVTDDIDGNPRPEGPGWDIGAYEYTP